MQWFTVNMAAPEPTVRLYMFEPESNAEGEIVVVDGR